MAHSQHLDQLEQLRTVKAMQTETCKQLAALRGLSMMMPNEDAPLWAELVDAQITARKHIQALEHVASKLVEHGSYRG